MKFLSFKNYLIISRPIIFPLILLCLFVALFYSTNNLSQINFTHILFIFLLSFFLPFFTFSINDLEDFQSDKINSRKKGILFGKFILNLNDYSKSIFLYNFLISFILILYSLIFFNIQVLLLLVLLLFSLYFYSAKPLRFKEKFFFDFFSNGLIALLTFLLIFTLFNDFKQLPIDVYIISISIMSYHLIAAQIDISADKKAKHKTTATIINNKEIVYFICILLNLPLLFVSLKGNFKFLFYVNILIILLLYFFPKIKKKWLFLFFLIGWVFITISYIYSFF
jgi:lycopene elongase/hydratase (dihydrobisanhydrobacterioruberin-forming)